MGSPAVAVWQHGLRGGGRRAAECEYGDDTCCDENAGNDTYHNFPHDDRILSLVISFRYFKDRTAGLRAAGIAYWPSRLATGNPVDRHTPSPMKATHINRHTL
jgi:hypothetical protein